MGKTSNDSKQKWIAKNFKQVKVLVAPSVAEAFKKVCAESGQSVNKALSTYMENAVRKRIPKTVPALHFETKPQRRVALQFYISQLRELYEAECGYNENIPENFRSGERFEQSCQDIEKLEEAIDILEDVF